MREWNIDVAFTPRDIRPADVAVVIDVLRATTTIAVALAGSYRSALVVPDLERARALRGPGRVLAGERGCARPPDFDLGNSPSEMTTPRGEQLVLSTTNGAPAVVAAAAGCRLVLLGCLMNLDAVVEAVAAERVDGGDVLLVCSGTMGGAAVEDVYVAGRMVEGLQGPGAALTDAALTARILARAHPSPVSALGAGRNAELLRQQGLDDDIALCARVSTLSVVPRVLSCEDETATVTAG